MPTKRSTYVIRFLGLAVAALIIVGLLLPGEGQVRREHVIDAQRATVFALLNDFRQIDRWSPIADGDPNARVQLSGAPYGAGAAVSWSGRIVGDGMETIIESEPFARILTETRYGNGRQASKSILLDADSGGTRVTWTYRRDYGLNLAGRYFALLLDGIVGPGIETDLARLAEFAERLPRADFSDLDVEHIVVEATDIAYLPTRSLPRADAISAAMSESYYDILDFIDRHDLDEAGAPMSITRSFSGGELVFDAAIPVRGLTGDMPGSGERVQISRSYEGAVIRAKHVGAYAELGRTHDKIAAYLAARGIERKGDAWESYVSDPRRTDESGLVTYIYYPVRN
jgi:effector-binding domain-containing protein